MKTTLFLAVALLALSGCGQPLCQDAAAQQAFVSGCTRGGSSSSGFCNCVFDYLADRYACQDMGNVSYNVLTEGCRACGGGC